MEEIVRTVAIGRHSIARFNYQCDQCKGPIRRRELYGRFEPTPWARRFGGAHVRRYCGRCLGIPTEASREGADQRGSTQLQLPWDQSGELSTTLLSTQVVVVDFSSHILRQLASDPSTLFQLGPDQFELLVCEALAKMGHHVERVGAGTYGKDGGIDIVAVPRQSIMPFLIAVQVKYHRTPSAHVGAPTVQQFRGAIEALPFNAGLLITNTTFTPNARWVAAQKPMFPALRDMSDLARWLREEFLDDCDWRDLPEEIEVAEGILVRIPR